MDGELIPPALLQRKAVVYVRQSTQTQVEVNGEGRRRQCELVDVARRRGFHTGVIDDDLGRSASGMVAWPGFEKLVAALCAGEIGAVLCFEASRLVCNGRDWHHLLELCGLVEARVIDLDGVYDPCRSKDRLLLGMKGSISEFELGVIQARMLDAARAKARRGELRISVPIGYLWHRETRLDFDPDIRLRQVIRLVFERFRQLGSARQVHLSLSAEGVRAFDWQLHKEGYAPMAGQIVDAPLVPAPKPRNSEAEKAAIKVGKTAREIWPGEPNKAVQKDTDARWTLKNGGKVRYRPDGTLLPMIAVPVFGCKSYISVNRRLASSARAPSQQPTRPTAGSWAMS